MTRIRVERSPQMGQQLRQAVQNTDLALRQTVMDIVLEMRWRFARRTPVLHGIARGNWRVGINTVDTRFSEDDADPSGKNGEFEAREIARNIQLGDIVYISNAAPYIWRLNKGHSKKAPVGWLDATEAELPFVVAQHARGLRDRLHGRGPQLGVPAGPT